MGTLEDMKGFVACALLALCLGFAAGETFFEEDFGGDWESRWVQSEHKDDLGKFAASAGKFNDGSGSVGLQTSQDAKFYDISAKFNSFSNKDKTLVVQYSVKHEQGIDCGVAYLKLGGGEFDGKKFHGETSYNVMFGPDICGMAKRTHLIYNYNNLLKDKDMRTESDELTHVYTLIVNPDNTFEVQIDGSKVEDGKLADGWKFLESKEIDYPEDKKPTDWVDEAEMDDPEAKKPDDWDDESDGAWEAPQVDNPEFKGEWKAKRIPNPAYKGVWAPKKIANPKYVDDNTIGQYADFSFVGIDIWQVKSGTIFDNVLITDSVDTAKAAQEKIKTFQDAEKKTKEAADAEKAKKDEEERKVKDAERDAKAAEDAKKAEADDAAKKAEEPAAEETKKEEL